MGQNEDCSQGDSTSDSSEKLLQRDGGGGGQNIYDFGEGGVQRSQVFTYKRFSTSHEKLMSVRRDFSRYEKSSAFLDMKRCKDWDHEISF